MLTKRKKIKHKVITLSKELLERINKTYIFGQTKYSSISTDNPISIDKNCVIILDYEKMTFVKVDSKSIAESFRKLFYNIWENASE